MDHTRPVRLVLLSVRHPLQMMLRQSRSDQASSLSDCCMWLFPSITIWPSSCNLHLFQSLVNQTLETVFGVQRSRNIVAPCKTNRQGSQLTLLKAVSLRILLIQSISKPRPRKMCRRSMTPQGRRVRPPSLRPYQESLTISVPQHLHLQKLCLS